MGGPLGADHAGDLSRRRKRRCAARAPRPARAARHALDSPRRAAPPPASSDRLCPPLFPQTRAEAARHGYAGRLFGITFALVAFGLAANDVGLALPLARILGIVIGIALAVLANAALLPRSGSEEALAALGGMLGALEDAARAAWGSADREAAGAGGAGAVTAAGAPGSVGAARAVWAWGGGAHSMAAAEAAADRLYGSSKTLDEALAVARYEIYAGRLGRHACLLPGGPCLPCATCKQLAPAARVCAAQRAARSAARVLWAINLALAQASSAAPLAGRSKQNTSRKPTSQPTDQPLTNHRPLPKMKFQGWEDADWAVIVEIHHPSVLRRVASGAVGAAAALRRDYAAALAGRAWRDGGAPAGGKAAGAWRRRGAPAAADPAPAEEVLEELEAAVAELLRHTQENRHRYLLAATSWAASRRPGASAPVFTGVATAGGGGAGAPLPQPRLAETHAPPARPAEPFALFPDDARGLRVILRWRALCWDVEQLAVEFRGLRLALEALTLPGGRPAAPPPAGPAAAAGV